MQKVKSFLKNFWSDESGQGTAEYVLLIAIVVALVVAFKDRIRTAVVGKMEDVSSGISGFSGE